MNKTTTWKELHDALVDKSIKDLNDYLNNKNETDSTKKDETNENQ